MEYETNEKKKLKLVDIPGNDRIRKSELEKYKVSISPLLNLVAYLLTSERSSWNRFCCQLPDNFKWN